ncbi:MAG TPA: glycoside hydrolase family 130 protein [candidate division Zixibacteria bacterium]|nr:glycoside hydrolase family 130 protein [candidate division Zixibacteria bacterium]
MQRDPRNPILTRSDIPSLGPDLIDVSSVFNPGAVRYREQILLLLRVQNRGRETYLLPAVSNDGVNFEPSHDIVRFKGIEKLDFRVYHVYDPRIVRIGDVFYITLALDTDHGCRVGLALTKDFRQFDFIGVMLDEDARNAVLFPAKINNRYYMLYRPNRADVDGGVKSGSVIELASSDDLLHWRNEGKVMEGRFHYWDELIGSGPPPILTQRGWLHIYHGVATHFAASNIYQAGVVLLDPEQPQQVLGRSRCNILEPRELYEQVGQVSNVVFPTGLVPERTNSEGIIEEDTKLFVYYGAADSSVCLATTTVRELLEACDED